MQQLEYSTVKKLRMTTTGKPKPDRIQGQGQCDTPHCCAPKRIKQETERAHNSSSEWFLEKNPVLGAFAVAYRRQTNKIT